MKEEKQTPIEDFLGEEKTDFAEDKVAKVENGQEAAIQIYHANPNNLPDLSKSKEAGMDLVSEYWSPQEKGETKRMFYTHTGVGVFPDTETGEEKELTCAFFVEVVDGTKKAICNGSKRLVGAISDAKKQFGLSAWSPLQVTYLGKKKNATNSYLSDTWSVKPLYVD